MPLGLNNLYLCSAHPCRGHENYVLMYALKLQRKYEIFKDILDYPWRVWSAL